MSAPGARILSLYPFEHFDPIRRRWARGRHRDTLEAIAASGRPFRILGAPELREVRDASALVAGHLASSPRRW